MKYLHNLSRNKPALFLSFLATFFFLFRIPSFFEPYWYGDEGIYEVIGFALRHGRLLYQGIWDNKPPLLYLVYALFDGDQSLVKIMSALVSITAIIFFFFLSQKVFVKEKVVYVVTILFALLLVTPFIEGNIANAENFLMLPTLIAMFFLLHSLSGQMTKKTAVFSTAKLFSIGILFSVSFLFKIVGVFDFAAGVIFLLFLLVPTQLKKIFSPSVLKEMLRVYLPLFLGFFLPILFVCLYFFLHGAFGDFLYATFLSNFGYVSYGNKLIIPQGFLLLKLLLLSVSLLLIFLYRKKLGNQHIFILIWVVFSLFNIYFSQRPYTHYTLLIVPSICLLIGAIVDGKKHRYLFILTLLLTLFLITRSFYFYGVKKTVAYYSNFISYVTGKKTTDSYQAFFDSNVPRDYTLAAYLKYHHGTHVFMWGDSAQIYALAKTTPPGRYAVAYHILQYKNGLQETNTVLQKTNLQYILILPNTGNFPFSLYNYRYRLTIQNAQIYEQTHENIR